jgi:alpha-tubulin suppressor-like RCC1 family protein
MPTVDSTTTKFVATSIAAGMYYTCAALSSGSVLCWGYNGLGQLGHDSTSKCGVGATGSTDRGVPCSLTPIATSGITNAISVAVDEDVWGHTCAVLKSGSVQCWGYNGSGELGNGTTTDSSVPISVTGISDAIAVAVGVKRTCAVLSSGTVQCWGKNSSGELGNGTMTDSSVPVSVTGISDAIAVATDGEPGANNGGEGVPGYHTCAVLRSGTVQCWGDNGNGELGNGIATNSSVPVSVSGITNAVAVSGGGGHTCAVLSSGTVQCWGLNSDGELGNGGTTNSSVPVSVSGITNAIAVATSGGHGGHTCAVLSGGSIQCWGLNNFAGQLGNGTTTGSSVPVPVTGITNAVAVTTGAFHTCAVLSGGSVQCWGLNTDGELGITTTNGSVTVMQMNSFVPVAVSGF